MAPRKKTESVPKKREFKLDVFRVLRAIDQCDINFMDTLSEEEKKALAPSTIMRWVSAVSNSSGVAEHYINTVNEFANIQFWDIYKHPELQYKLLACCGVGEVQKHDWIALIKSTTTSKFDNLILDRYPHLNQMELGIVKAKFTEETLTEFCRDFAMADSDIKPILADFKKYQDNKIK